MPHYLSSWHPVLFVSRPRYGFHHRRQRLIEASLERVDQFTKNRHIGIIHSTATRIFRHRLTTPLNTHRVAPLLGSKLSASHGSTEDCWFIRVRPAPKTEPKSTVKALTQVAGSSICRAVADPDTEGTALLGLRPRGDREKRFRRGGTQSRRHGELHEILAAHPPPTGESLRSIHHVPVLPVHCLFFPVRVSPRVPPNDREPVLPQALTVQPGSRSVIGPEHDLVQREQKARLWSSRTWPIVAIVRKANQTIKKVIAVQTLSRNSQLTQLSIEPCIFPPFLKRQMCSSFVARDERACACVPAGKGPQALHRLGDRRRYDPRLTRPPQLPRYRHNWGSGPLSWRSKVKTSAKKNFRRRCFSGNQSSQVLIVFGLSSHSS